MILKVLAQPWNSQSINGSELGGADSVGTEVSGEFEMPDRVR
jgi:hypothetical protein